MVDLPIPSRPGATGPARSDAPKQSERTSARPTPSSSDTQGATEARPAFKALLEMLQQKARDLEEETKRVEDASHLAGAVEGARSSLEEALSLGEELLESFRQNRHQTPPSNTSAAPPRPSGEQRT